MRAQRLAGLREGGGDGRAAVVMCAGGGGSAHVRQARTDLLGLHGRLELCAELQVCDGDVLQVDVEVPGAVLEVAHDAHGHLVTLGDELGRVVLRDDLLQHLVHDAGQHLLVVVCECNGAATASAGVVGAAGGSLRVQCDASQARQRHHAAGKEHAPCPRWR